MSKAKQPTGQACNTRQPVMTGVADPRCEYSKNPIGLEVGRPRFSWVLVHPARGQFQTAYQVLVTDSVEKLMANTGNLWDSGRVPSTASTNVVYRGAALESGKTYYWKVRWWDADGNTSVWSEPALFEMGLLKREDWKAKWIQGGQLLRKEFTIKSAVIRARAYVCGLGYYELRINGQRVGDRALDPGWTAYEKRALYTTYDVTALLKHSRNAFGVILGRGRHIEAYGYGPPKVILQLNMDLADGSQKILVTDESWRASDGPIISDDIYNGVKYDARLERHGWDEPDYDDSAWRLSQLAESPKGELTSCGTLPPVRVVKHIQPVVILVPKPEMYVYDFSQNFTGWVRLRVEGPAGAEVKLRHSELVHEDGSINTAPNIAAEATDAYILRGEGVEEFEPRFTYHGFRYVEVTGFPGTPTLENLEGRVVYSDVTSVGGFICSNPLINHIHRNVRWGQISNLMSVPTDCPQRSERMGWMGDAQLSAESAVLNFWMPCFYEKFVADMKDAQADDGSVPDVVPPYWKLYPADPAWGTAYTVIPWLLYLYYSDVRLIEQHYEGIKKWVEFLASKSKDNILPFSKYGDWCPPAQVRPLETPGDLLSTWVYYHDVLTLSRMAKLLTREEDAQNYSKLAEGIRDAFNRRFLREDHYAPETVPSLPQHLQAGSQTCNVLPLALDMVPNEKAEAVLKSLVKDVEVAHDRHLNTGIVGTRYLLETLTKHGRPDLAYSIATQKTYPSWGYMVQEGATTIWERWEYLAGGGMNSHNHIMFGSVDSWFYKFLAGVTVDPSAPAFERTIIRPNVVGDLRYVSASLMTVKGLVCSEWIRSHDSLSLKVTLPVNTKGEVHVPKMGMDNITIRERKEVIWRNAQFLASAKGVMDGVDEGDRVILKVGSGAYVFHVSDEPRTSD